jgi:hypothetical protein
MDPQQLEEGGIRQSLIAGGTFACAQGIRHRAAQAIWFAFSQHIADMKAPYHIGIPAQPHRVSARVRLVVDSGDGWK